MIKIIESKSILDVYETYKQDYHALNWNESLKNYMNETIGKFYSLNGTLYYINYRESNLGHFTYTILTKILKD